MAKIYIDTSVVGGCFDVEFKEPSLELFEVFKTGLMKVIYSDIVIMELLPARQEIKDKIDEIPVNYVIDVENNEEVEKLADTYIQQKVLTNKSYGDALHIALATLNNADTLASWNFKHIVNIDKIKLYNAINLKLGYKTIEIMTPKLILKSIIHEKEKRV
ncbi:hypothetical protein SAMN05518672_10223 [Chitinophaga sp. CF118]|uniref:hypothetical protein n=1 Tax=Chitinophaga sp. CF118 TaxID=1884367 RepID=UPI0008E1C684|nr:hypothetical protein [Chitinophaga sp. CF118]SFD45673.1 hypothetical protein SAMN05518672_10223 [Chitinophaga sp. CF118]